MVRCFRCRSVCPGRCLFAFGFEFQSQCDGPSEIGESHVRGIFGGKKPPEGPKRTTFVGYGRGSAPQEGARAQRGRAATLPVRGHPGRSGVALAKTRGVEKAARFGSAAARMAARRCWEIALHGAGQEACGEELNIEHPTSNRERPTRPAPASGSESDVRG